MECLPFNIGMILRAKEKSQSLGSLNNSILEGHGNIAGYLGEEALSSFINATIMSSDDGREKYNHDLLLNGKKIEVKTKRRTCKPYSNYDVSVVKTSMHQVPDIYAFVSIECNEIVQKSPKIYKGIKNIWLCGFVTSEYFKDNARFIQKGQIDPSNGFKSHADMYNMSISSLKSNIRSLL